MRNIIVTGATSGIGASTARYLANHGYFVIVVARNESKLKKLCGEFPGKMDYYVCDLKQTDKIAGIFEYCHKKGMILNGMVHCAGIGGASPVRSLDVESQQAMMTVNCFAFVEMAKHIINRKYGADCASLVAISSLSSMTCYSGMAAYSMSKVALNAACKVLSKEVIRRGIRVNTIMPANVKTPMTDNLSDEELLKQQFWGFIDSMEIAYLVEFLLSDKSMKITGANIPVSAGMEF